jgi:uncharacterized protein (DUF1501 family)
MVPPIVAGIGCGKSTSCKRRVIILRLQGGHDSLSAIIPLQFELEKYRPRLYKEISKNGIIINEDYSLNNNLSDLLKLKAKSQIAFLPYVGYERPDTSHFKSTEIWECGAAEIDTSNLNRYGFFGRELTNGKRNESNPIICLHNAETLFDKYQDYRASVWTGDDFFSNFENDLLEMSRKYSKGSLGSQIGDAIKMELNFKRLSYHSLKSDSLSEQFSMAKCLINNDCEEVILHLNYSVFDTHVNQNPILNSAYRIISNSLNSFVNELSSEQWKNTCIVVHSEFGRSLYENESGGTDHGSAGLVILATGDIDFIENKDRLVQKPTTSNIEGYEYMHHQTEFTEVWDSVLEFLNSEIV